MHMEDALQQRVVGQEPVVKAVANAIRLSRAGLQSPSRPLASFLFLGPTGVGKSELSKTLAEFLFADEKRALYVFCSSFALRLLFFCMITVAMID